eukprot:1441324-Pyramimonas_sp.AAC.1
MPAKRALPHVPQGCVCLGRRTRSDPRLAANHAACISPQNPARRAAGAVASRSRALQPGQRGRYVGDLRPERTAAPKARPAPMARPQGPRHGTTA